MSSPDNIRDVGYDIEGLGHCSPYERLRMTLQDSQPGQSPHPILREPAMSAIEIKEDGHNKTKERKGAEKSANDELSQERSGEKLSIFVYRNNSRGNSKKLRKISKTRSFLKFRKNKFA